jgi:hypothetical protein
MADIIQRELRRRGYKKGEGGEGIEKHPLFLCNEPPAPSLHPS